MAPVQLGHVGAVVCECYVGIELEQRPFIPDQCRVPPFVLPTRYVISAASLVCALRLLSLCNFVVLVSDGNRYFRFALATTLLPKPFGDFQRVDIEILPPCHFVAGLMQLPMMAPAERHGELVADLHADGAGLGKAQVVRIGWLPPADEARLRGNEL